MHVDISEVAYLHVVARTFSTHAPSVYVYAQAPF